MRYCIVHNRDSEGCKTGGGIMIPCETVPWNGVDVPPKPEDVLPQFIKQGLLVVPNPEFHK